MHASEDDLILHFYGDADGESAARVDAHLAGCGACRQTFNELQDTLRLVDAAAVPEPGPAFERVTWARVQAAIGSARPRRAAWWTTRPLLWAASLVLVAMVSGAVAVRWFRPSTAASTTTATAGARPGATATGADRPASRTRERLLLSALDDHFQQTELLLVEIMNSPAAGGELQFERQTAGDLVASNRLYHETAVMNGDVRLAQMLEDLETVLVEVAHAPARVEAADLTSLRDRITDDSLLFKVRAVSSEVRKRQRDLISDASE